MIAGSAPVRPLPRRKGPRGVRQVEVSPGRWMDEAEAEAQGIPTSYPLPTAGAGPVTVRRADPEEASSVPSPTNPATLPPVALMSPPTTRQREAWAAYHAHGGQTAAGRVLGIHQAAVRSSLIGYMRAVGIEGPIPPPDASLVGGPERVPLGSDEMVVDARPLGPLVDVAESGADHAGTIPRIIPDADPGHEMTASTGGEPEPVAAPAQGTPAPHQPAPPLLEDLPSSAPEAQGQVDPAAAIARLARERDEMEMARDELREMLDDALAATADRPARERYLDALLAGLAAHPSDNIRDRIERVLGIEADRDAWADGYRRALGDILDAVRSTRGTAYPQQDIIERIARLAIAVPEA